MGLKDNLLYADLFAYTLISEKRRDNIKERMLRELVSYAKTNSPFYAEHYKGIGDDFTLAELPPVSKTDIDAHFDDWATDRDISRNSVDEFMRDSSNTGKRFLNKYLIETTSGTSGQPVIVVKDEWAIKTEEAISSLFVDRFKKRLAIICEMGSFYGLSSVCQNSEINIKNPDKWFRYFGSALPAEKLCWELNAYQPNVIRAFSSYFDILVDYQERGLLHIHPKFCCGIGEAMMQTTKDNIERVFGCPAYEAYGCTEMGLFASSVGCSEGHMHLFDQFTIVEPVDANGNPTPEGVLSDSILVTHLANKTQPLIRYKVDDRIIVHREKCSCGNKHPWLECEGRFRETPRFYKGGKLVSVFTAELLSIPDDYYPAVQCNDFQINIYDYHRIELKFNVHGDGDKHELFEKMKLDYLKLLAEYDDIEVVLSEETLVCDITKKRKMINVINNKQGKT